MRETRAGQRYAIASLILAALLAAPCIGAVQVGGKVAGFRLTDTAGKTHDLADYAGKVVVLEFWSFKCPVSLAYDERMAELYSKYGSRGVSFLAVASNKNESPLEIRRNVENLKLPFPVLIDQDGVLADRVGATHTPSVFVLDGSGTLRYRGAIDNNKRAGERGRVALAEQALDAILGGTPVPEGETKVFGCGIRK